MENTIDSLDTRQKQVRFTDSIVDTSFVLFFLAVDLGQTIGRIGIDTVFSVICLTAVAVLPYFIVRAPGMNFGRWIFGRGVIVLFALVLGLAFNYSLGVFVPEAISFLPFSLLILTAMLTCYLQFYNFFTLRTSR